MPKICVDKVSLARIPGKYARSLLAVPTSVKTLRKCTMSRQST